MQPEATRRTYLRRIGAAVGAAGLAATPASAADCDATVYTNATEGGEPKLEVPAGEARVTGESTCDPGTKLYVWARKTGGASPFSVSRPVTVGDAGGWVVTFDFSNVDPGTSFDLWVTYDGEELDRPDNCEVVADAPTPRPTPTATPTATPEPTPTPTASPTAEPTPTPESDTPTPTATSESTPTAAPGGTPTPTAAPAGTTAGGTDGDDPAGEGADSGTAAPGFGVVVAAAALAAAAARLGGDR